MRSMCRSSTFLLSVNAPLVYNAGLYKNLPYDPFRDLQPVSLAATTPNVCVVSNAMGVGSVKGWLAAMQRNPGKFNFASTGSGSISHLGVELIKHREIAAVLRDEATRQRLSSAYFDPVGGTPQELSAFMNEELRRWKPVIERAGLKPEN